MSNSLDEKQIKQVRESLMKLSAVVDNAKDFAEMKEAVLEFIEELDTKSFVLGDGDLVYVAAQALERRGKPIEMFNMLARGQKMLKAQAGK